MGAPDLRIILLDRFGLRLGPAMLEYLWQRLPQSSEIPVIGLDSRTGIPRRQLVDPRKLPKEIT